MGAGAYGRLTYQVFEGSAIGDLGLHIAGGAHSPMFLKLNDGLFAFAGPVLAKSFGGVTVRASIGLIATNSHDVIRAPAPGSLVPGPIVSRSWGLGIDDEIGMPGTSAIPNLGPFVPNLEVAFRLNANHELTLGGNAIIGWRGRFGDAEATGLTF